MIDREVPILRVEVPLEFNRIADRQRHHRLQPQRRRLRDMRAADLAVGASDFGRAVQDEPSAHPGRGAGIDLVKQSCARKIGAVRGGDKAFVGSVECALIVVVGVVEADLRPGPDADVIVAVPVRLEARQPGLVDDAVGVVDTEWTCPVFVPRTPERRFVAGETHLYLGRQYRLKVVPHVQESVKLIRGFIVVQTHRPTRPEVTRELVEAWYRDRAHIKFPERIELCLGLFPDPEAFRPMGLIVRQTRQRWGSMSPAERLLLNRRLVQAPVDAIDYVITHELCHVAEPHHGAAFFDPLDKVMPDWERRKQRLERAMA